MLGLRSQRRWLLNSTAASAIRIFNLRFLRFCTKQSTKRKLFSVFGFHSKTLISIVTLTLFLFRFREARSRDVRSFSNAISGNESNKEHNKPPLSWWLAMFMPQRPDSGLRTPRALAWTHMLQARLALMKTNISWIHKRWQINSHLTLMYPLRYVQQKFFSVAAAFFSLSTAQEEKKRACNRYYLLNRLTSRNIDIQMRKNPLNRSTLMSVLAK